MRSCVQFDLVELVVFSIIEKYTSDEWCELIIN